MIETAEQDKKAIKKRETDVEKRENAVSRRESTVSEQERRLNKRSWDMDKEADTKAHSIIERKERELDSEKERYDRLCSEQRKLISEQKNIIDGKVNEEVEQIRKQMVSEYDREYEKKSAEKEKALNAEMKQRKAEQEQEHRKRLDQAAAREDKLKWATHKATAAAAAYTLPTLFAAIYGIAVTVITGIRSEALRSDTAALWGGLFGGIYNGIMGLFGYPAVAVIGCVLVGLLLAGLILLILSTNWEKFNHKVSAAVILADAAVTVFCADWIGAAVNVWVWTIGILAVYVFFAAGAPTWIIEQIKEFIESIQDNPEKGRKIVGTLIPIMVIISVIMLFWK